jgi:uncharacterized protein YceH (UPF0502 family)
VARLPREPRRKDHAYTHLFSGAIESAPQSTSTDDTAGESIPRQPSALAALEARVTRLEQELATLKKSIGVAPNDAPRG